MESVREIVEGDRWKGELAAFGIVCPKCKAAIGGKCLEKVIDRSHWIETPHPERVEAAKQQNLFA